MTGGVVTSLSAGLLDGVADEDVELPGAPRGAEEPSLRQAPRTDASKVARSRAGSTAR
jgi:hypothetical protein